MGLPLSLTSSFLSYLGDHTRETAPRTSEVFRDQRGLHHPSLPSHIPGSVDCCRFPWVQESRANSLDSVVEPEPEVETEPHSFALAELEPDPKHILVSVPVSDPAPVDWTRIQHKM